MSFFNPTQEELNAAFLEAAAKHKFEKAYKLLKKGAQATAVDTEGNNAFHLMAMGNPAREETYAPIRKGEYSYSGVNYTAADKFIRHLMACGLDINLLNNKGEAPLHLIAGNAEDRSSRQDSNLSGYFIWIFLNAGADPNMLTRNEKRTPLYYVVNIFAMQALISFGVDEHLRDYNGHIALHIFAREGAVKLAEFSAEKDSSLLAIADNKGFFSHDLAQKADHIALANSLQKEFLLYRAYQQGPQDDNQPASPPAAVHTTDNEWKLLSKDRIAHVLIEKSIGCKITNIFNFNADWRERTTISQNLETKLEGPPTIKGFDEFADLTVLKNAYKKLIEAGGEANENVIYRNVLNTKCSIGKVKS